MRYEFLIAGRLSDCVRAVFEDLGFQVRGGPAGGTVVFGPVRDQAALRGALARFDNLGLTVIEMRQLPD